MVGRELKSAPSHFLIVLEVGTASPPAPLLDVIRKNSAQPERVVPKMRSHEEAATRIRIVDVAEELCERTVHLVVGRRDSLRAIAKTEMDHERAYVVGHA